MFKLPENVITKVRAGEEFIVARIGHGIATLCSPRTTLEYPSAGVKLGERFFATGTNRLVRKLTLKEMISKTKDTTLSYKGNRVPLSLS